MSRPRLKKTLLICSATALALALVLCGLNVLFPQRQTLYVVSGLDRPVVVEVAPFGSVQVRSGSVQKFILPTGRHQAVLRGAVNGTVDFRIPGGLLGRWSSHALDVLNVAGSALLASEQSDPPTGRPEYARAEARLQFHYGQPFVHWAHVDYPFVEFPESVLRDSRSGGSIHKTRVDFYRRPVPELIHSCLERKSYSQGAKLAEWWLRWHPEETPLLPVFFYAAKMANTEKQALAFLREGTKRRPVEVVWHQFYQEICRDVLPAVVAEYDACLKTEPDDSALLYLRGRLCGKNAEALPYFERAAARDAGNAFALFAAGSARLSAGDWEGGRPWLAAACRLRPEDGSFQAAFFETRLALGEFPSLVKDLQASPVQDPMHVGQTLCMCDVLLAQDRQDEGEKFVASYEKWTASRFGQPGRYAAEDVRRHWLYAIGDFAALEQAAVSQQTPSARLERFQALLELGRVADATTLFPLHDPAMTDPFHFLIVSLAWAEAGNAEMAAAWRKRAVELFRGGLGEGRLAAQMLERHQPVPLGEAMEVALAPKPKALLLAALSQPFPQQSPGYAPAIRRLNVGRLFPCHLLNRLAAKLPEK
jgi:hypothetical protein